MKNYVEITFERNLLIKSVVKEDEHFVRPKMCVLSSGRDEAPDAEGENVQQEQTDQQNNE